MDEYDELYGIEDDFEQQFADELEVLAEMEVSQSPTKAVERHAKKPQQTFEEAITATDPLLMKKSVSKPHCVAAPSNSISPGTEEEPQTPLAKRRRYDVAKKLKFDSTQRDDITPPSSPEVYESSRLPPPLNLSPDRPQEAGLPSCLDISGLGTLQETPVRVVSPKKHVLLRPPATGDFVTVTDSDGNRVYLSQREEEVGFAKPSHHSRRTLGLLAVPIDILREQVAERRHTQVLEESKRLSELLNSNVHQDMLSVTAANGGDHVDEDDDDDGHSSHLWVDRFSPRHYTELLSDDFTNRCLLKWLKLWDTVVFGRERKSRPVPQETKNSNHLQNSFKTKSQISEEILEAELDQHKRPKYKVALLSGPPGLGKTTLAHIIAKQAGYNVVEINASDDRSAELFKKRIDTATQMKSVLGANEKPNCLVIDEIDGAPAAAINVLLATLNRKDGREEEESGTNPLKKKKKESVLLRPIICICNDLYVPALRPLRQQAFLLTFPPTQPSRLTQRLAEISRHQGMKVDTGSLMALCEKTDNDIRACINTLQFLHGRGQRQLDHRSVTSVCVGQKDQNKGLFSVWQGIFQLPRTKRKRIDAAPLWSQDAGGKEGSQRVHHILHLAASCGESDKLTLGLYDNFLNMKLKDPSLRGVCAGLDWLCFSDVLNDFVFHTQNYSLMRYSPFLPAAFHLLFAQVHTPRINYPSSHYEAQSRSQQVRNALVAMLTGIPAAVRGRLGGSTLCLDILSLLLELISPKLRPVNPQLYSSREKQLLCELIDTMINYNLSYRQDRSPEGQYTYVLEPNVEDVVRFPGLPPRRQLTYQVKQLIARETELERMRRAERIQQKRNVNATKYPNDEKSEKQEVKKASSKNHQQRLENIVKQTVVESRPEVDFFGRAIVPKEKPVVSSTTVDAVKGGVVAHIGRAVGNSDVWFRFNEGVSNAVRRCIYIRELL